MSQPSQSGTEGLGGFGELLIPSLHPQGSKQCCRSRVDEPASRVKAAGQRQALLLPQPFIQLLVQKSLTGVSRGLHLVDSRPSQVDRCPLIDHHTDTGPFFFFKTGVSLYLLQLAWSRSSCCFNLVNVGVTGVCCHSLFRTASWLLSTIPHTPVLQVTQPWSGLRTYSHRQVELFSWGQTKTGKVF